MKLALLAVPLIGVPAGAFIWSAYYSPQAVTEQLLDRLAAASDDEAPVIMRACPDGWDTSVIRDVDRGRWLFISAGPDVAFGTQDDVIRIGRVRDAAPAVKADERKARRSPAIPQNRDESEIDANFSASTTGSGTDTARRCETEGRRTSVAMAAYRRCSGGNGGVLRPPSCDPPGAWSARLKTNGWRR
jgi:hypothetical protein